MTYAAKEESTDAGAPVEFYRFAIGTDRVYRYTSARTPQIHNFETYSPVFSPRTSPAQSPEIEQNKLTVRLAKDAVFADLFKRNAPARTVWAVVFRKHETDGASPEVISYWQGRVESVRFKDEEAEITCGSLESMLRREGLRPLYQATCRFFLYDGRCPVPASAFQTDAVITSTNGDKIISSAFDAFPDGWFTLGFVEDSYGENRFIIGHSGSELALIAPFETPPTGALVSAFAGCDQLHSTCDIKFGDYTDEGRDFGGHDLVPINNPYEKGVGG